MIPSKSKTTPREKAKGKAKRKKRGSLKVASESGGSTKLREAADRVLAEGGAQEAPPRRGRPPGSKTKPKAAPEPERIYIASEQSVRGAAILGATIWKIAGNFLGYRALNDAEAMEFGKALDPVLFKYVPILSDWQAEINLLVIVVGLAQTTRIKREKEEEALPQKDAGFDIEEWKRAKPSGP
jgi:hypothetical protein